VATRRPVLDAPDPFLYVDQFKFQFYLRLYEKPLNFFFTHVKVFVSTQTAMNRTRSKKLHRIYFTLIGRIDYSNVSFHRNYASFYLRRNVSSLVNSSLRMNLRITRISVFGNINYFLASKTCRPWSLAMASFSICRDPGRSRGRFCGVELREED